MSEKGDEREGNESDKEDEVIKQNRTLSPQKQTKISLSKPPEILAIK